MINRTMKYVHNLLLLIMMLSICKLAYAQEVTQELMQDPNSQENMKVNEATVYQLATYLEVSVSPTMDVTFQLFEGFSDDEKILVGWSGEQLNYAVTVTEQPGGFSMKKHFKGLRKAAKRESSNGKLSDVYKGEVNNVFGFATEFRVYATMMDGDPTIQIIYVISNKTLAYHVVVYVPDTDLTKKVLSETVSIMETARLLN